MTHNSQIYAIPGTQITSQSVRFCTNRYLHLCSMELYITIKCYHSGFGIGLQDIRSAWLLQSPPLKLSTASHRGALVYRLPKGGRRISYRQLKKGLVKKTFRIAMPCSLLPF